MKLILKGAVVVAGIALATALGPTVVAVASPSTTFAVQDGDSGNNGAAIDSDGTMGDYKAAVDGTMSGPLMVATPQT
ncbi:hypothetical protein FHT40_004665 [Mycolicibacterium sp. BK556]|uniref:hypothetical protein n=1 Tax=Mycobacteriaceae TaxID=1762 RepID=UPI00105FC6E3|nr:MULTISPECIES: hypothetical protein [Mycobacteriaceae]MBB3604981.1 hypothetical protein [Mycolicibacterium sp. BK556]MBB3635177.1 hypothetical protein [Mycolicibacterium sp. BK607]MBB3748029.1 hypothetical protein [Mycolicibacterium sp. BK634]TDO07836.1 hypothetical protein EV580_5405 [Mycobacterium sp. BK086]